MTLKTLVETWQIVNQKPEMAVVPYEWAKLECVCDCPKISCRSRTSGRHSPAGGSVSLGMGSERNWLRSPSRLALSVSCLPWRMWSLGFLSPPAVAVSSPRNTDSASGTKSQKKLFLPKADSSGCFFTESEEQLIHPLGLYGTRHETFSESSPRKPSP